MKMIHLRNIVSKLILIMLLGILVSCGSSTDTICLDPPVVDDFLESAKNVVKRKRFILHASGCAKTGNDLRNKDCISETSKGYWYNTDLTIMTNSAFTIKVEGSANLFSANIHADLNTATALTTGSIIKAIPLGADLTIISNQPLTNFNIEVGGMSVFTSLNGSDPALLQNYKFIDHDGKEKYHGVFIVNSIGDLVITPRLGVPASIVTSSFDITVIGQKVTNGLPIDQIGSGMVEFLVVRAGANPNAVQDYGSTATTGSWVKNDDDIDVATNGDFTNQDTKKTGILWLRIRDKIPNSNELATDPGASFIDNLGAYSVMVTYPFTRTEGRISDFLWEQIDQIQEQLKNYVHGTFDAFSTSRYYKKIVYACLVLYISLYCLFFLAGMAQIRQVDLVVRLVKFAIIAALISDNAWYFFNDYLFNFFTGGSQDLIRNSVGLDKYDLNLFRWVDRTFDFIFNPEIWKQIGAIALYAFPDGTAVGLIAVGIILFTLYAFCMAVAEAAIGYMIILLSIALTISIAPIFLLFLLFSATKPLFDNWMKFLISSSLQPAIFFTVITLLSKLFFTFFLGTVAFRYESMKATCWGQVIKCVIPLDWLGSVKTFLSLPDEIDISFICGIYYFRPGNYILNPSFWGSALGCAVIALLMLKAGDLAKQLADHLISGGVSSVNFMGQGSIARGAADEMSKKGLWVADKVHTVGKRLLYKDSGKDRGLGGDGKPGDDKGSKKPDLGKKSPDGADPTIPNSTTSSSSSSSGALGAGSTGAGTAGSGSTGSGGGGSPVGAALAGASAVGGTLGNATTALTGTTGTPALNAGQQSPALGVNVAQQPPLPGANAGGQPGPVNRGGVSPSGPRSEAVAPRGADDGAPPLLSESIAQRRGVVPSPIVGSGGDDE